MASVMAGPGGFMMVRGFRMDPSVTKQKLKPGTIKRIAGYARPYRVQLSIYLFATAIDAAITVINPLLLRQLIDNGIIARDEGVVIAVALTVAGVTLFDAFLGVVNRYFSSRIGEDRKSTRLNSSHSSISYAVFCLKKKKKKTINIALNSTSRIAHLCIFPTTFMYLNYPSHYDIYVLYISYTPFLSFLC